MGSSDYQAVYDAVRSRFNPGPVGDVIADAVRSAVGDFSYQKAMLVDAVACAVNAVQAEQTRSSVLFRPNLVQNAGAGELRWAAVYGPPESASVVGFGATPDAAMRDFDAKWTREGGP